MKHTIRILLALAVLLMSGSAAWAQRIAVSTGIANGTVVPDNANPTGTATVTLTVTPATGYYITASDITVKRTALGAHGRHQTPAVGEPIAVTKASVDDSGKGTYTFSLEDGYGAYVEATFTACSAITPTVSITGWTYGSAANAPTVTGNSGNGTVTYDYKVKGAADATYSTTVPTAAGDYTVRATIAAAGHYLGNTATTDFTISKKDIVISGIKANNKVYDGNTSATLDFSAVNFGGIVAGDALTVTATGAFEDANVGTGKTVNITGLTLGGTSIANYQLATAGQQTTTTADITATGAALVTAPTAIDRTYDGTAKDLVNAGTATNGTLQYRLSATDAWTATIPQATDAGTYNVYYKVKGDANYGDIEYADPIAVTISKAGVTVTITGHNNKAAYDGTEHSVSGYEVSISDPLYKETDFTFTGTASAKRTDPGMTTMGLVAEQFTNNNPNFNVTFNVTDGYQTITSPDEVIVMINGHSSTDDYDGTEHSVSGYDVVISNPLYKESDFTFTGTAMAARTDAGTTNMGLNVSQFTNNNKNFTVTFSVTDGYQTISPIAVTVTVTGHNNTVAYDGEEHSVSGYEVSFSNKLYKESDITFTGTATATRTDEGKTDMGLTADQFSNNNPNFNPVTFNIIDGYQTITSVTDVVVTITGYNNTADYDGTAHSVNGYEVSISNPLYKETDFTFTGTATATRTDAGTTNMGLDASQFKNNNGDFTNVTFKVTDGYQTISPIKATVTIKGHNNIAIYDGTPHSVSGYDVSFSNNLYKEADFTFTGSASAARTDQGTAYMGLAAGQFANTNANFSIVTFNVIDGYQTINKKVAVLTVTVAPKTYDGKTEATVSVTVETGVKGETITITGLTGTFDNANAGTDKTVTVNSSNANVKAGANTKLDNYEVNYPTQANGTITKRPVVVSGITAQDKTYDGNTDATLVFDNAQFDGLIGDDKLTVTATGEFENAEAGNNKTVNITGLTLGGTSVANYMLAAEGQQTTTTASIISTVNPVTLVTAPTAKDRTYDGTAQDLVNAGTATNGTLQYRLSDTDAWTATIPQATNAGTYQVYYKIKGDGNNGDIEYADPIAVTINKRPVTVSGITAHDKNFDTTIDATLVLSNAVFTGIIAGDILTVTATGEFENAEVGNNKTVTIYNMTLGGTSIDNYVLAATGNQTTTTASILPIGTIDRRHSGIEVRRNDTQELVENDAFLTKMTDGTLRIDRVEIIKPADATAKNPVSVSVWIPATLTDHDKTTGNTYGVGNDIIVTDANVPVTDIYMPDTEDILDVTAHAFRLDPTESETAFIHVSLPLLDDYALCTGLKAEYEAGKVMTTVTPTTKYWTLSSGVDIVVPGGLNAYICMANSTTSVAAKALIGTTAIVDGIERTIIKANNGAMMYGIPGSYDLRAWPCPERPSGMKPSKEDAKTYEGNELVPAIILTHFTPTEYYILYNNVFHELDPLDETFVSPCKAVLRKTNPAMARNLTVTLDDDAVGIRNISHDENIDETWYTIDGRKLDGQPTRKGLYILNGVKVIIK